MVMLEAISLIGGFVGLILLIGCFAFREYQLTKYDHDKAVEAAHRIITENGENKARMKEFVKLYSYTDKSREHYTDDIEVVPLFRVLDAIDNDGKPYSTGN